MVEISRYPSRWERFSHAVVWTVFVGLFAGFVLGDRSFAHLEISLGGLPLYITEGAIALSMLLVCSSVRQSSLGAAFCTPLPLVAYWLAGLIALGRGLVSGDGLEALRDSALVYYSFFFVLAPVVFRSWRRLTLFLCVLGIAAFISTILGLLQSFGLGLDWIAVSRIPAANSMYASFGFLFAVLWIGYESSIGRRFAYLGLAVLALTLIAALQVRAAWVALVMSLFAICGFAYQCPMLRRQLVVALVASLVALAGSLLVLHTAPMIQQYIPSFDRVGKSIKRAPLGAPSATDLTAELNSMFYFQESDTTSANNVMWRLLAWKDIVSEWWEHPMLGVGFGKPFMSPSILRLGWGHDPHGIDPHNSLLAILYRMGLLGLMSFAWFAFRNAKVVLASLSHPITDKGRALVIILVATSVVNVLGSSLFTVVLEGPYMGSFFWLGMGILQSLQAHALNSASDTGHCLRIWCIGLRKNPFSAQKSSQLRKIDGMNS